MAAGDWDRCFTALLHFFVAWHVYTDVLGEGKSSTAVAAAAAGKKGILEFVLNIFHHPYGLWWENPPDRECLEKLFHRCLFLLGRTACGVIDEPVEEAKCITSARGIDRYRQHFIFLVTKNKI